MTDSGKPKRGQKAIRPGELLRGRSPSSVKEKATSTGHKGPGRDNSNARAIATAERHAQWLQRRKEGWSYRRIAADSGVAMSTVEEAVWKQLAAIRQEPAKELLNLELEALDDLIDKSLESVDGDELERIELVRKLRADRRKLLGTDAPSKVAITQSPEQQWEEVRAWLREPTPELEQVLQEAGWRR